MKYYIKFINLLKNITFKELIPYLLIGTLGVESLLYEIISEIQPATLHNLTNDLDKAVPFIPAFIIPYMLYLPNIVITLALVCFYNRDRYYLSIITLNICNFICLGTYLVFQTTVGRPEVVGTGLISDMVRVTYAMDNPINCFPSIHVCATFSALKGLHYVENVSKKILHPLMLLNVLVIVSTQFVKQHVLMDMLVGLILVQLVYKTAEYVYLKHNSTSTNEVQVDL